MDWLSIDVVISYRVDVRMGRVVAKLMALVWPFMLCDRLIFHSLDAYWLSCCAVCFDSEAVMHVAFCSCIGFVSFCFVNFSGRDSVFQGCAHVLEYISCRMVVPC